MKELGELLKAARAASLAGEHRRAVELIGHAVAIRPTNRDVGAFAGLVLWKAQDHRKAQGWLIKASRDFPGNPEIMYALIDSLSVTGLPKRALRLLASQPVSLQAWPLIRDRMTEIEVLASASGPDRAIEQDLIAMHNVSFFRELDAELAVLLDEWPQWALGRALRASAQRHLSFVMTHPVDLEVGRHESAEQVQHRWERELAIAWAVHHERIIENIDHALVLDPQSEMALQGEVRARFQAGMAVSSEQVARLHGVAPEGLLGPFPLVGIGQCKSASLELQCLQPAAVEEIGMPNACGGKFDAERSIGRAWLNPRYLGIARGATVAGSSDVTLLDGKTAISGVLTGPLGLLANWRMDRWIALRSPSQLVLKRFGRNLVVPGRAISLLGAAAEAFGHWLMDYLPRLRAFPEKDLQTATILVDEGLPPTLRGALELVLGRSTGIIEVATGQTATVDELLITGPDVLFPHSVLPGTPDFPSLAPCCLDGMRFMRERVTAALVATKAQRHPIVGRLFVKRRANVRLLVNEQALVERLERDYGFEALDPAELSFADQAWLFSQAEFVVGPQGSALTNCLFCAPGVQIMTLCSPHSGNLPSWGQALERLGNPHRFVVGQGVPGSNANPHNWHFEVNANLVAQEVGRLLGVGET